MYMVLFRKILYKMNGHSSLPKYSIKFQYKNIQKSSTIQVEIVLVCRTNRETDCLFPSPKQKKKCLSTISDV